MKLLEYFVGLLILGGGFALVCLALRWLLTKVGCPGTGEVDLDEPKITDPDYKFRTGLKGVFDYDPTNMNKP